MTSAVLQALRAATHHLHETLDARLDLPARLADMCERRALVRRFQGFQAGLERALGKRLDKLPGLELARRRRAHRFDEDLAALRAPSQPSPPICPVPRAGSIGEALGLLYVGEGSTLGGKVIGRRLTARGASLTGLGFLDPYGDDTGSMWRGFLVTLEQQGGRCQDQVVAGGVSGFTHAVDWLCDHEALT